ncbi:alpha/beta hydrolase [Pedobacter sp. P351]|uniref:alpha/beta fold hydrolase n=1 Tax=Pedobacter superstes TaxID=3133441 RepID=UPI00309D0A09
MEILSTKVNAVSVTYLSKQSGNSAATIVFIHGFPFNKTIWNEQLDSLPDGISAIAYDIRGFGGSSSDHSFFSIDLFANDLIMLIDTLQLENCVLCGISMGGYIALRAIELSQKNVKGLILCDTNCVADSNEGKMKRFNSIEQIVAGGKGDFTEGFIKNVFTEETLMNKPETVQFLREVIMGTSDKTICSTLLALASRTETCNSLLNINVPTLIIRGENDKLMSEDQTKQLAEGITQAEQVNISTSGHLPNLENPEDFNKAINTFLNKHFLS